MTKFVPDGNCKTCRIRKNCFYFCTAAKKREERMTAQEDEQNRRIKKALLMQIDKNNESFREKADAV